MGNIALTDVIPQDSLERQLYFIEKCKAYVADLQEKLGRPLTCCTQTFGCQMNARDSEKLLGILTEIGYVPVETEEADLVLYNTCTVRENANLRVYGRLGHLNGLKKKNPHMIIALCGCMMQETQVVEKSSSLTALSTLCSVHSTFSSWQNCSTADGHRKTRLSTSGTVQKKWWKNCRLCVNIRLNPVLILCTAVTTSAVTVSCHMCAAAKRAVSRKKLSWKLNVL